MGQLTHYQLPELVAEVRLIVVAAVERDIGEPLIGIHEPAECLVKSQQAHEPFRCQTDVADETADEPAPRQPESAAQLADGHPAPRGAFASPLFSAPPSMAPR